MNRLPLLAVIAILLCGVLLWLLYPRLASLTATHEPTLLWQVEEQGDCDLHRQACRVAVGPEQWVELAIAPRPIGMLTPFVIRVQTHGLAPEAVSVDFNGVDMNMGYNRPKLAAMGEGLFEAGGLLPMCVLETMRWRAQVLVDMPEGRGIAAFEFDTTRKR